MEKVNFQHLEKIEKKLENISELNQIVEDTCLNYEKINSIQSMILGLKQNPKFAKILNAVKDLEKNRFLLMNAEKVQIIQTLSVEISANLGKSPYLAYDIIEKLEKERCLLEYIEEMKTEVIGHGYAELFPVFSDDFIKIVKECQFPFQSKGEILSQSVSNLEKFKDLLKKLKKIKDLEYPTEILIGKIKDQIIFHFLSEQSTNRIDKPEWLLDYSLNSIKLNILYFLEFLEIDPKNIEKILHRAIYEIIQIISKRIFFDTRSAIENNKETLFLHIIDEVIKFDMALNEFRSKDYLMTCYTKEKTFLDVWASYEKVYIIIEVGKIFTENGWEVEKINGNKFNNINEIILLHNSLIMKYSNIFVDEIKNLLTQSMNNIIIDRFIISYEEVFNIFKTNMFHYESGAEQWNKIYAQIAALHQGLVLFQQFILNIDKSKFAEFHFRINHLKKEIVNKIMQFIMFTIDEVIGDYIRNGHWKEKNTLRIKVIEKIVKDMKKSATQELSKLLLSYTSQKIADNLLILIKNKKIEQKYAENIVEEFQKVFKITQDDTERFEYISSQIIKT